MNDQAHGAQAEVNAVRAGRKGGTQTAGSDLVAASGDLRAGGRAQLAADQDMQSFLAAH